MPDEWCIEHGSGWKDPKCPDCFPERVRVFEGEITSYNWEPSHPTVGDWLIKKSLRDFLQDRRGKRVRVMVEVLDA